MRVSSPPWQAPVLDGSLVRLEPLEPAHADGLWDASRDPRTWRWLSIEQPATRDELDAWGAGVNVEAKLLMLGHAFDTWGCRRVELKTDALNERSRGAMEAMGARFEGIHRHHMLVRRGENRDSAWYSILDDEWSGVRAGLEARLDTLLARRRSASPTPSDGLS